MGTVKCTGEGGIIREIDAEVRGNFAVHRSEYWMPFYVRARWSITHVGTGFSVGGARTKRDAINAVKELEKIDFPWSSKSPRVFAKLWKKATPELRARLHSIAHPWTNSP